MSSRAAYPHGLGVQIPILFSGRWTKDSTSSGIVSTSEIVWSTQTCSAPHLGRGRRFLEGARSRPLLRMAPPENPAPSSIISCCWDGKSSAACSASARKINRDQDRAAGKTPCSPIEQRISKTSRNSMTKIRFRLDLPHHKTQLGKGWTVCWPGTHARFYNSLQRRWNRQFDKACNWPVRVNHAFDAISDVKNIGFG